MGLNTKVKSKGHILNMSSFIFLNKHFIEILYCVLLVCYLALQGLSRITYKQKRTCQNQTNCVSVICLPSCLFHVMSQA